MREGGPISYEPRPSRRSCPNPPPPHHPNLALIVASISKKTRFRGSPVQFATKLTTQLLLDVTASDTCVVILAGKSYFPEMLAAMSSHLLLEARAVAVRDHDDRHLLPAWGNSIFIDPQTRPLHAGEGDRRDARALTTRNHPEGRYYLMQRRAH